MASFDYAHAPYTQRPQSRQNSGARSFSEMLVSLTVSTPEAQNALEELERGNLRVMNEKVKIKHKKDSPFARACFYLEDVIPENMLQNGSSMDQVEALLKEAQAILTEAHEYLDSEKLRVQKLIDDNLVDVKLGVRNQREYEVASSTSLYRTLIELIPKLDEILLNADRLRFSGFFTAIQRKNTSILLHRAILRAANKLIAMEGTIHKELFNRDTKKPDTEKKTEVETEDKDKDLAEKDSSKETAS